MANGGEILRESKRGDAENKISLRDVVRLLWFKQKRILLISVVVGILTLAINYLIPNYYKATATLLPETEKGKLLSLGQFSDVAQKLLGDNIPGSEIARLYPTVLTSQTILRAVFEKKFQTNKYPQPVNLIEYFQLNETTPDENIEGMLRRFKTWMTATTEPRTSVVTITIQMPEAQLAADVLNAIVAELDNFMRQKKNSNASEQVSWIEVRLKQVEQELQQAEEALKAFREKNRRVSDSPQLLLVQERLARQVQVNSTVFIELKKQYELAKLEEIKNITIVNVLDPGRAPALKEGPRRKTNAAIFLILAYFTSSAFFVTRSVYGDRIRGFLRTVMKVRGSDEERK